MWTNCRSIVGPVRSDVRAGATARSGRARLARQMAAVARYCMVGDQAKCAERELANWWVTDWWKGRWCARAKWRERERQRERERERERVTRETRERAKLNIRSNCLGPVGGSRLLTGGARGRVRPCRTLQYMYQFGLPGARASARVRSCDSAVSGHRDRAPSPSPSRYNTRRQLHGTHRTCL